MEHMRDPEAVRGNNYPLDFTELHGKKLLFKIDTKVVSPNRYNGTFRVRRIYDYETVLAMFSLKSANLTPSKAIFTPKLTPAFSMRDFYGLSLGDSTAVNLVDDNVANLGDDSGLKMIPETIMVDVEARNHEKHVSKLCDNVMLTPTKRNLKEEFDDVASSPGNEKLEAIKVEID